MTKAEQTVADQCIKSAGRIARAINALSTQNVYPECDKSHSFFSPYFPLELSDWEMDHTLNDQLSYLVRKFARYMSICFHDVRVTFISSKRSICHSPSNFLCGYFRIDYVAIAEITSIPCPVSEHRYGLYMKDGKMHNAFIVDYRGPNNGNWTSQVLVQLNPINPGDIHNQLSFYVDAEELIPTDAHYLLKGMMGDAAQTSTSEPHADELYRRCLTSNIPLPPYVVDRDEKRYLSNMCTIISKYAKGHQNVPYEGNRDCGQEGHQLAMEQSS